MKIILAILIVGLVLVATGCDNGRPAPKPATTMAEACADTDGPYVKGKDPEYGLYDDRDHDGVVCE